MKLQISKYQFDKTAGTITFPDYAQMRLAGFLLITNVNDGIIIYNFADPAKGGILQGNILTLSYDTSGMDNADNLQVIYEDVIKDITIADIFEAFSRDGELMIRTSDDPLWGDAGPIQQHEKESPNQPIRELMTFDSNLHTIFGSQNLTNNQRLKVEEAQLPEKIIQGKMAKLNDEVTINLTGQGSVILQLIGTWAGTMTFTVSNDRQTWYPIYGQIPGTALGLVLTSTANGIFRFNTSGVLFFRIQFTTYTSGIASALLISTPLIPADIHQFPLGSQSQLLSQKASTYELNVYDTYQPTSSIPNIGLIKDALQATDPWNPLQASYNIGDTCLYKGQVYICIAAHSALVAGQDPANATYWIIDKRQNKSLITSAYVSPPSANRMRVEIDLDGYQYRLMETQNLSIGIRNQLDLAIQDYHLALMQSGVEGKMGKAYALGWSGMGAYNFDEIR